MPAPDVRCKCSHLKRWPCLNVCICLSGSHGAPGWGLGGGAAKIWQIAENCLHTVIPVWTHLAHLDGIWQQKNPWRRAQLTEWCHILTLPPPTPTLSCLWGARSWRRLEWCLAVVPPVHSRAPLWLGGYHRVVIEAAAEATAALWHCKQCVFSKGKSRTQCGNCKHGQ